MSNDMIKTHIKTKETFSNQIFLFNDLHQPKVVEKCNLAIPDPKLPQGQIEEGFQRTSRLSDQIVVSNSKNLNEYFSDSEFEDEEILAISSKELKISKGLANLANRVSNLSDNDQVKRFIRGLKSEEFDESDSEYCDAESTLDSNDEYTLAMEPIVNEVARMEAQDKDALIEKCSLFIVMEQPEEVDESIIRDILKIDYDRANEPSWEEKGTQFSFTMEDIRKPETSRVLLEDLSVHEHI